MAIIKKVQIETNGVLNDIGAKYDEAENPIRGTYGASLDLPIETEATGGTSIQLVAKDNTILSTVNLELDASVISDGILPVEFGGTGVSSFTANSIIMSGNSTTSPLITRPITDNTTNIAISNNNTNIPTMNTIYYGLATINGNSQYRGINIYAPTDVSNAVLNDVAVYNSSTGAAEFKTLATTQVNTGYHFEENQTLDSNATSGITARVTTTSNNLGVLELSWISLSSDGAATVATGGFTDSTATAAYADGNVRSW